MLLPAIFHYLSVLIWGQAPCKLMTTSNIRGDVCVHFSDSNNCCVRCIGIWLGYNCGLEYGSKQSRGILEQATQFSCLAQAQPPNSKWQMVGLKLRHKVKHIYNNKGKHMYAVVLVTFFCVILMHHNLSISWLKTFWFTVIILSPKEGKKQLLLWLIQCGWPCFAVVIKCKKFFRHIVLLIVQDTSKRAQEADGFRHNNLDLCYR